MGRLFEKTIGPFVLPFAILAVIIGIFAAIGEMYIALFVPGDTPDRLNRPELWVSIALLLGVIALIAFLASRPKGALGPLENDVVVGSAPLWSDELAPVTPDAVRGEPGTTADINAGYTLYAQSGALARVLGVLPGGRDYGKSFSGFLHAEGVGRASKEMWIPIEAVSAVYPESQTAFLAIKGDETEAFGWTAPPESLTRGETKHRSATEKVK